MKHGLSFGAALSRGDYEQLRRACIFECCKWDPQVGDSPSLFHAPLIIDEETWRTLSRAAESLYRETIALERELLHATHLHRRLGLGWRLRGALRQVGAAGAPSGRRIMRFDFHPTTDGWRVSEVNCDVPGGFIEASGFTSLMAAHYSGLAAAPDVVDVYARALLESAGTAGRIAMVHATGYSDDRQVMVYLSRRMESHGARCVLAGPSDITWRSGRAHVWEEDNLAPIDLIVRFFPAEWLVNLGRRSGWQHFFAGSATPQSNPATAILMQSKRVPLVWHDLPARADAWRRYLPETVSVTRKRLHDPEWVLKPALGRVGEGIGLADVAAPRDLKSIRRNARLFPRHWIAQRRFHMTCITLNGQSYYPGIGVFVVDGQACGAYARVATRPLIDMHARDAALLIAPSHSSLAPPCDDRYPMPHQVSSTARRELADLGANP